MKKRAVVVGVCAALSTGAVGVQALALPSDPAPADAAAVVPLATEVQEGPVAGVLTPIEHPEAYVLVGDEGQYLRAAVSAHPAAVPDPATRRAIPTVPATAPDKAEVDALARAVAGGSLRSRPVLIRAYLRAARTAAPGCHLTPELLAGIGQVESGNVGGRAIGADHVVRPGIYGPPLTGGPFANIPDSDGGRLDGSAAFDRAVGPMQFIPTSWELFAVDGDGDGSAHPQNVFDAAATAGAYLCADGRDLSTRADRIAAVFSYNHSTEYVNSVLGWAAYFERFGLEAIGQTSTYVPSGTFVGTPKAKPATRTTSTGRAGATARPTATPTRPSGSSSTGAGGSSSSTTTSASSTGGGSSSSTSSSSSSTTSSTGSGSSTGTSTGTTEPTSSSTSTSTSSTSSTTSTPAGTSSTETSTTGTGSPSTSSTSTSSTSPGAAPTGSDTTAPTAADSPATATSGAPSPATTQP